ncbi:hypothetical protein ISS96_02070 [Candidatus Bathyarchaeota archaeon]|nr:hypothetical protein [Candidatus Bathyarchaeota archaeon]
MGEKRAVQTEDEAKRAKEFTEWLWKEEREREIEREKIIEKASKRSNKKLKRAVEIVEKIDDLLMELGDLIESAESREQADEIYEVMSTVSYHLQPEQISDIWGYLVDWGMVAWKDENDE